MMRKNLFPALQGELGRKMTVKVLLPLLRMARKKYASLGEKEKLLPLLRMARKK